LLSLRGLVRAGSDRLVRAARNTRPKTSRFQVKRSINDAAFALEVAEGKDVNIVKFWLMTTPS